MKRQPNIAALSMLLLGLISVSLCQGCYFPCRTCKSSSPYACTSCLTGYTPYLFTCQDLTADSSTIFIVFCVLVTLLFVFMVCLGHGMYREMYQSIQMASLITWGYGSQAGGYPLQGTNLGLQYANSFWLSFSPQFIVIMIVWCVFWFMVIVAYRFPHKPIAVLLIRKQLVFPTRLFMFFYNIVLYTALIDIWTKSQQKIEGDLFGFILACLAVGKMLFVFLMLIFACNWSRVSLDDPNYYILAEKMRSTRWWVRNNLVVSLLTKTAIIFVFVLGFESPSIAGVCILCFQAAQVLYIGLLLRYKDIRYYIFNLSGALLLEFILLCSHGCATSQIGSQTWQSYRTGYFALTIILCCLFLIAGIIQLIILRASLKKQTYSIYRRFIICQDANKDVEKTKYDETFGRQRVTNFKANLLHKKNLTELESFPKDPKDVGSV